MLKFESQTNAKQIREKVSQWIHFEVNGVAFKVSAYKDKNKTKMLIDAPKEVKIQFGERESRVQKR